MSSPDILQQIVATKRAEVAALRPRADALRELAAAARPARAFAAALRVPGEVRLLAEVKRRSPSAGEIRPHADPVEIGRAYARGGAAAISVLTDHRYFGGSLADLGAVVEAVPLPVLRKDFVIDPLQLWEARGAGADAVLLIARILDGRELGELLALAAELEMDALVEVHSAEEMARAVGAGAGLIGINNRDLAVFRTDLALAVRLAAGVPPAVTLVAESGIHTPGDVDRMGAAGIDAVLVGESLMRQPDAAAAAARLTGRPRGERAAWYS